MKMKNIALSALLFLLPAIVFSQWTGPSGSAAVKAVGGGGGLNNWRHSNVGIGINQYGYGNAQTNFGLSFGRGKKWYLARWAGDKVGLGFSFDYANMDFAFGESLAIMQFGQAMGLNLSVNLGKSTFLDLNSHFLGYELGFGAVSDNVMLHAGYFSQYNPIIRFDNFYVGPVIHYALGGTSFPELEVSGDYARFAFMLKVGFVKF